MSFDVQGFVLCDHRVSNKDYDISRCPRCYGRGHYFDVYFDKLGQVSLTQGTLKLQQELLKVCLEEQGGNPFHPFWGQDTKRVLEKSSKNINIVRQQIEIATINSIEHLVSVQEGFQARHKSMTPDEMISSIENINVGQFNYDGCQIQITVKSKSDENTTFGYAVK